MTFIEVIPTCFFIFRRRLFIEPADKLFEGNPSQIKH